MNFTKTKQERLDKLNQALTGLEKRAKDKGEELDAKEQYNFTEHILSIFFISYPE